MAATSATYIRLLICLAGWSGFEGKFIPPGYNFTQPFLMGVSKCRVKSILSGLVFGLWADKQEHEELLFGERGDCGGPRLNRWVHQVWVVAGEGDALVPGTGSSLAPCVSLVSEGLRKEQLHAVSWIPALRSGTPRAQIIAGFPVDFETGRINASLLGQSKHSPPGSPRHILLCEDVA